MTQKRTFTDEQVMDACEISQENLRKLIQWGAVRPVQSGGGRGKVRLWDFNQANRISVTAQLFNAGLSLRMAHTLAYALPLDDMLMFYDVDLWEELGKRDDPDFAELMHPDAGAFEYYWRRIGHVVIAKGGFVYTDALAQSPTVFGYIDRSTNTYVTYKDPSQFYWGMYASNVDGAPRRVGVSDIDPKTLALKVVSKEEWKKIEADNGKPRYMLSVPSDFPSYFQIIALYMGLSVTFRKLLGLPVERSENYQDDPDKYDEEDYEPGPT
ncbi:hypothetical protein [Azospirillum sp. TSO22-1]|uniref:hypothetical protein n=1 Tax=Azospirillum sp. TSO22-1 TaxID=716789 RepID=UPI0011B7458D|nr:hypothetical protein [Azospirillum sp. TSO22-1]